MSAQESELAVDAIDTIGSKDELSSQYLTFMLGDEYYGVDILRVQEIKGWTPVTAIPNTPKYIKGVLNLRGTIVPIVDLRNRFNLESEEYTALTVIIVLSIQSEQSTRVVGVVVDSVSDVMNVSAENIKPTPELGSGVQTDFIHGMATTDDQMAMLLDIDKMMSLDELTVMEAVKDATDSSDDEQVAE